MMMVRQDQRFFIDLFPHGSHILLLSGHVCVIHVHRQKNSPSVRCTNRHSEVGIFSPSKFQEHVLELSFSPETSKWISTWISFERYHRVFDVCPGCRPSLSWKTYPYVWTSWLSNFEQSGSVLQFQLSVSWHCVGCLSVTIWQSRNNIPSLLRQSFWTPTSLVQWTLRVVCYNVTVSSVTKSPRNTTLSLYFCNWGSNSVFWWWQNVHQCSKVDFLFVSLSFEHNILLTLDFFQMSCWSCLELFPFLVHCNFCIRNFHRLRQKE